MYPVRKSNPFKRNRRFTYLFHTPTVIKMLKIQKLVLSLSHETDDAIVVRHSDTTSGIIAYSDYLALMPTITILSCEFREKATMEEFNELIQIDRSSLRMYGAFEEVVTELLSPHALVELLTQRSKFPDASPYLVVGEGVVRDSRTGLPFRS